MPGQAVGVQGRLNGDDYQQDRFSTPSFEDAINLGFSAYASCDSSGDNFLLEPIHFDDVDFSDMDGLVWEDDDGKQEAINEVGLTADETASRDQRIPTLGSGSDFSDCLCDPEEVDSIRQQVISPTSGPPQAMNDEKPSARQLYQGLEEEAKEKKVKLGICQDNGFEIVVEAVTIEDESEQMDPETPSAIHDAVVEVEHTQQNPKRPATKKGGNGGRPVVWPRDPKLNSCQNSRKRKQEEYKKLADQLDKMEEVYGDYHTKPLDVLYRSLNIVDEPVDDEPKPRAAKRAKAETEDERKRRKRAQNKEQTRKYRQKRERLLKIVKAKWDILIQKIPVQTLESLGIIEINYFSKITIK